MQYISADEFSREAGCSKSTVFSSIRNEVICATLEMVKGRKAYRIAYSEVKKYKAWHARQNPVVNKNAGFIGIITAHANRTIKKQKNEELLRIGAVKRSIEVAQEMLADKRAVKEVWE